MQRVGILNSEIAKVLADLGHTDRIVIADCGLPIPDGVPKIDLALRLGEPSFRNVLSEIVKYMKVESYTIANEIESANPKMFAYIKDTMGDLPAAEVMHETLKEATRDAKVIIRTGEATPFSNIILQSGCIF